MIWIHYQFNIGCFDSLGCVECRNRIKKMRAKLKLVAKKQGNVMITVTVTQYDCKCNEFRMPINECFKYRPVVCATIDAKLHFTPWMKSLHSHQHSHQHSHVSSFPPQNQPGDTFLFHPIYSIQELVHDSLREEICVKK